MLALAASELASYCGDDAGDDLPEACWRHPDAGLMCPRCAVTHRQEPGSHPWPDELAEDVCDNCGTLEPREMTGDFEEDWLALLQSWPPRTRAVRVVTAVGDRLVMWPMELCDRCSAYASSSRGGGVTAARGPP
jgi:hypothetical protein